MSTREANAHGGISLISGFVRESERHPDRTAVEADGASITYTELRARASRVSSALAAADGGRDGLLTAVLGSRGIATFAGIVGALLRGHGYVPLGLDYPASRNAEMLARSGARTLVVDRSGLPALEKLLALSEQPLTVLLLESGAAPLPGIDARHTVVDVEGLPAGSSDDWRAPSPTAAAYVLFTSGTTGRPKGVAVTHANVRAFLDAAQARYQPTPDDRFSQTFSLTFDLSVFDLFVAWDSGACVCCASDAERLMPGRYIKERRLSFWFSVPSLAVRMGQLRQLGPNQYPTLRYSLFCGEALPSSIATAWSRAAAHSVVENLYGPTELTIACTWYRWDEACSPFESTNGLVPIGCPIPGMSVLVANEQLEQVAPGEIGELLMTGPQLTPGYLNDPERTRAVFVRVPDRDVTYYRTGDLVRQPQEGEPLQFVGRRDTQVKIRGFRVELGEVEAAVREQANTSVAVALAWPRTESGADSIIVLVDDPGVDGGEVLKRVRDVLPSYMVPQEIRRVPALSLNSNGKVDRPALEALLAGG